MMFSSKTGQVLDKLLNTCTVSIVYVLPYDIVCYSYDTIIDHMRICDNLTISKHLETPLHVHLFLHITMH